MPTYVFLDRSGENVARLVGHQTLASLRQSLAALVGEQCAGVGFFQNQPPHVAPSRPAVSAPAPCPAETVIGPAPAAGQTCGG